MSKPIVLAMSGASGAIYAVRLLQLLLAAGREVHLTVSPAAQAVIQQELGVLVDLRKFDLALLLQDSYPKLPTLKLRSIEQVLSGASPLTPKRLVYHHYQDYMTPIASGSFLTEGMVIAPCSGSTLSGVVHASSNNLIQRAADVHLKERRKLILMTRETPLSTLQLENMARVSQAGATVLPASPGWYHTVNGLEDLVDFVVARIMDHLGVEHRLMQRWGQATDES
jgi:4-hydroxy-3-polyprenylbenzoate decarboxylase